MNRPYQSYHLSLGGYGHGGSTTAARWLDSDPAMAGSEPLRLSGPAGRTLFESPECPGQARDPALGGLRKCFGMAEGVGLSMRSHRSAKLELPLARRNALTRVICGRTAFESPVVRTCQECRACSLHGKYRGGGRGGIRTHGRFNPTFDFESSALNRAQPPFQSAGIMP